MSLQKFSFLPGVSNPITAFLKVTAVQVALRQSLVFVLVLKRARSDVLDDHQESHQVLSHHYFVLGELEQIVSQVFDLLQLLFLWFDSCKEVEGYQQLVDVLFPKEVSVWKPWLLDLLVLDLSLQQSLQSDVELLLESFSSDALTLVVFELAVLDIKLFFEFFVLSLLAQLVLLHLVQLVETLSHFLGSSWSSRTKSEG